MKITRLPLKKLNNTRDLGGLPAADGKVIKHGCLFRSGRLYNLPKETIDDLHNKKKIATVVDLRVAVEVDQNPDTKMEGVEYLWYPILCTATVGITAEKSMRHTMTQESKRIKTEYGNEDNYMIAMYRSILTAEASQKQLKAFLNTVLNTDKPILWHCSGGKDRAGLCAMLIEGLLGVDDEVIVIDYVASTDFQRRHYFWRKAGLYIVPIARDFRRILFGLMNAKPMYIEQTLKFLNETYGGIIPYCKQCLGVTDEQIALLRQKYLQEPTEYHE